MSRDISDIVAQCKQALATGGGSHPPSLVAFAELAKHAQGLDRRLGFLESLVASNHAPANPESEPAVAPAGPRSTPDPSDDPELLRARIADLKAELGKADGEMLRQARTIESQNDRIEELTVLVAQSAAAEDEATRLRKALLAAWLIFQNHSGSTAFHEARQKWQSTHPVVGETIELAKRTMPAVKP